MSTVKSFSGLSMVLWFLAPLWILLWASCSQEEVLPASFYSCSFDHPDSSAVHPHAARYQEILEDNLPRGMVGGTMLVTDQYGTWTGAAGMADLASEIEVEPCHPFLIASISKVFTATVVLDLVEEGILSVDDPVTKWVPARITDRLSNADQAKISHLLSHTSGIPDNNTAAFDLALINSDNTAWDQEDILSYAYGVSATNGVGETYYYSNSNFILLGMIIESATGQDLADAYATRIFEPLGLTSAYYGTGEEKLPTGVVKGYADIYDNGQIVETKFLYADELSTPDGGIAINALELGIFFRALAAGELLSATQLDYMLNTFELPDDWKGETLGHQRNGYGIEYFINDYGEAIGHTGGIYGFSSLALHYPEEEFAIIFLSNCVTAEISTLFTEVSEVMFE